MGGGHLVHGEVAVEHALALDEVPHLRHARPTRAPAPLPVNTLIFTLILMHHRHRHRRRPPAAAGTAAGSPRDVERVRTEQADGPQPIVFAA